MKETLYYPYADSAGLEIYVAWTETKIEILNINIKVSKQHILYKIIRYMKNYKQYNVQSCKAKVK